MAPTQWPVPKPKGRAPVGAKPNLDIIWPVSAFLLVSVLIYNSI